MGGCINEREETVPLADVTTAVAGDAVGWFAADDAFFLIVSSLADTFPFADSLAALFGDPLALQACEEGPWADGKGKKDTLLFVIREITSQPRQP